MSGLNITVQFGGGAELLFDNKKSFSVSLREKEKQWIIKDFLTWIRDNLLKERPELFLQDESVVIKKYCLSWQYFMEYFFVQLLANIPIGRPGILVLINDTDWELMDTVNYIIQNNDNILFISTLHGG